MYPCYGHVHIWNHGVWILFNVYVMCLKVSLQVLFPIGELAAAEWFPSSSLCFKNLLQELSLGSSSRPVLGVLAICDKLSRVTLKNC